MAPPPRHRRALPQGGFRMGRSGRADARRLLRSVGGAAAGVPARHGVELRRVDRRTRAGRRGAVGSVARPLLRRAILAPLKMVDTGFFVRDDQVDRAARLYGPHPATGKVVINPLELTARSLPDFLSGGGGLWGTAADYLRFCHMMLNR